MGRRQSPLPTGPGPDRGRGRQAFSKGEVFLLPLAKGGGEGFYEAFFKALKCYKSLRKILFKSGWILPDKYFINVFLVHFFHLIDKIFKSLLF